MNLDRTKLKAIKGDASFRFFFRKKNNKKKSIIVYSKKEKRKNLLIYDSINKLLIKNRIKAPKLYNENYNKNYIEIEDLGDETLYKVLSRKKESKIILFKRVISLLVNIQKIKKKKIRNFQNKLYEIPKYSKKILFNEADLFCKWYVPKFTNKDLKKKIRIEVRFLLTKIKMKNKFFVHRDFHVSNLIKFGKNIAIIDSQDALIGNKAYDLASLIDDVRFKTSNKLKKSLYDYYLKINQNIFDKDSFKNDFEILSILRNLKIIGIFTRLAIRDKKKKYLKLIPYAWRLIELRLNDNLKFNRFKNLLDANFSKKIRMKK